MEVEAVNPEAVVLTLMTASFDCKPTPVHALSLMYIKDPAGKSANATRKTASGSNDFIPMTATSPCSIPRQVPRPPSPEGAIVAGLDDVGGCGGTDPGDVEGDVGGGGGDEQS